MILDLFAGPGGLLTRREDGDHWRVVGGGWPNGNGYHRISVDGVRWYAHRRAYVEAFGPISAEQDVDHLCRVRWCCNPLHLEAVTPRENKLRGESPPAINARKERCPAGHEYDPQGDGTRRCAMCRYERRVASGEISGRGRPAERTHCPKGHPYDEINTAYVKRADGSIKQRVCRECGRANVRARRARGEK